MNIFAFIFLAVCGVGDKGSLTSISRIYPCSFYSKQGSIVEHIHIGGLDIIRKCLFGYTGFKYPGFELAVMVANAAVEVEGQAGNGVFVADISVAQSTGAQSAQAFAGLDEQD